MRRWLQDVVSAMRRAGNLDSKALGFQKRLRGDSPNIHTYPLVLAAALIFSSPSRILDLGQPKLKRT